MISEVIPYLEITRITMVEERGLEPLTFSLPAENVQS